MRVLLLGPQRKPTLGAVMASLDLSGPIATITAGWQEREPADSELSELLGGKDVNLSLYQRWLDVQDRDPEFAAAQRDLQGLLDEAQDIYLLRLDHALAAVYAISRRSRGERHRADGRQADARQADGRQADARQADGRQADGRQADARQADARRADNEADPALADQHRADTLQAQALAEAVAAVTELDAAHLHRANGIRGEFYARWQPHTRPVIAEHRAAVEHALGDATAVVISGGHVGVLADTLHLFNVAPALTTTVIAWSAGAMALTDQIVLFGDRFAHGPGHPEVYGAGLSVLRNLVVLPHARARLLLDDAPRMAVFARRFTPARCVLLESGSLVDTGSDGSCPPGTQLLGLDGRVTTLAAA